MQPVYRFSRAFGQHLVMCDPRAVHIGKQQRDLLSNIGQRHDFLGWDSAAGIA
jgi:hypothetical protein